MSENELRECPFCGYIPKLMSDAYAYKHVYYPQCLDPDCIMSESATTWPTKAAAIAAWNTRAEPLNTPAADRLAELVNLLKAWDEAEAVLIMHNAFASLPEHAMNRCLEVQQMRQNALAALKEGGRE